MERWTYKTIYTILKLFQKNINVIGSVYFEWISASRAINDY